MLVRAACVPVRAVSVNGANAETVKITVIYLLLFRSTVTILEHKWLPPLPYGFRAALYPLLATQANPKRVFGCLSAFHTLRHFAKVSGSSI